MDLFLVVHLYVIIFSALGVYFGSSAKTWSKRKYVVVLSVIGFFILFRLMLNYIPKTELMFKDITLYAYFSFGWVMPFLALLLTIAFHHMPVSRRSIYLGFGLIPFVMFFMTIYETYTYDYQKNITRNETSEGYCYQSTSFTCGPATGATVLHLFKIDMTERDLAIKGKTTFMTGMNEFLLKTFLNEIFQANHKKLRAVVKSYDALTIEDKERPVIITIKINFLVAHWIVRLSEDKKGIKCFDPMKGLRVIRAEEMQEMVRSHCIVFEEIK